LRGEDNIKKIIYVAFGEKCMFFGENGNLQVLISMFHIIYFEFAAHISACQSDVSFDTQ